jgi:hypothetical protein
MIYFLVGVVIAAAIHSCTHDYAGHNVPRELWDGITNAVGHLAWWRR